MEGCLTPSFPESRLPGRASTKVESALGFLKKGKRIRSLGPSSAKKKKSNILGICSIKHECERVCTHTPITNRIWGLERWLSSTAFPGDLSSIPSTHIRPFTIACNCSSRGSDDSGLLQPHAPIYSQAHMGTHHFCRKELDLDEEAGRLGGYGGTVGTSGQLCTGRGRLHCPGKMAGVSGCHPAEHLASFSS